MKQSIIVLFEELMQLEENFSTLYKNISILEGKFDMSIKNVSSVLSREELRHVEIYQKLIEDLKSKEPILIDVTLINDARGYLLMFKQNLNYTMLKSANEILVFALDLENKNGFILKQILELLLKDENENSKQLIAIFEELIIEEQKHALNLQKVIKY
ncbi:MAG: hypothetical protein CVU84_13340 [Firmicutes bacterium HGW-Firmicutes-1]|jgi:rubrerythrin|nr:MAG: hypothetical protein CVU84_13340 [Firmicutes bacterium HGW-Firmicutes-1]